MKTYWKHTGNVSEMFSQYESVWSREENYRFPFSIAIYRAYARSCYGNGIDIGAKWLIIEKGLAVAEKGNGKELSWNENGNMGWERLQSGD